MKLFTVGKMTERLQQPPARIEKAIDTLELRPELELNGLRYFDSAVETQVAEQLQQQGQKVPA
jgi:hypothetical protein